MAGFNPIQLGIGALSGIAGGLLNQNKTDTSGPTGSGLDLYNTLHNYYSQVMNTTPDFMKSYEVGGMNAIKRGADANATAMENVNASHGIRGPAAAYATMVPRVAAQGQVTNLQTSLPMVRSQYQNQIMQQALQGVQAGPHQQTFQGQPMGGAFAGLANSLAGMYGMNQMRGMFGGGSGMPNSSGTGSYDSSDPLAGGLPNGMENYIPYYGGND